MSVFHAVPTCYTTLPSVGMLIPTGCKCRTVNVNQVTLLGCWNTPSDRGKGAHLS